MQLTKNFSLHEFTKSNTAARRGIDNNPTAEHIHNLVELCEHVLQPLRDAIGKSIRISSGYRSAELNEAIGGASRNGKPTSDNCFGRAADIELVVDGENYVFDIVELDETTLKGTWESEYYNYSALLEFIKVK